MNKPDFPNWSFDLIVKIGGLCSIVTLIGFAGSAGSYITWLASMPFVSERQSQSIQQFANKTALATLPFLGGTFVATCTARFLLDREWERKKTQQDLDAIERIRLAVEQINAHELELDRIRPVLERISAEHTRLSEQMADLDRQLREYTTSDFAATDFYLSAPPNTSNQNDVPDLDLRDRTDCQFFNQDGSSNFYLRCSQEPCRLNCIGCTSFRPLNSRLRRQS